MANTQFKGSNVHTLGDLPAIGAKAPEFVLVASDLSSMSLADFAGKKKVITINPSYDTGVCQRTARAFNEKVGGRSDAVVLMVSADLPFAQKRFCEAEGISGIVPLSSFRSDFGSRYGVTLVDGPLRGLTARAVVVLDADDRVRYTELVPEITQEPDYSRALAALD